MGSITKYANTYVQGHCDSPHITTRIKTITQEKVQITGANTFSRNTQKLIHLKIHLKLILKQFNKFIYINPLVQTKNNKHIDRIQKCTYKLGKCR